MCSPQNDTRRHKTPPPPRPPGPEASRPTSTPLLLRRLAEGTCMGVGAPPYSSELSRRPARRRIRQGVVQSDPNIAEHNNNKTPASKQASKQVSALDRRGPERRANRALDELRSEEQR